MIGLNNIQVRHPASPNGEEPEFPIYASGPAVATGGFEQGNGSREARPHELQSRQEQLPSAEDSEPRSSLPFTVLDPADLYSSEAYDLDALYPLGHCCNPLGLKDGSPPNSSIAIATAGSHALSDLQGFAHEYNLAYSLYRITSTELQPVAAWKRTLDLEWATAWANSFDLWINNAHIWMYEGANAQFSTFIDIYNQIVTDGHARVFSTSWGCEEF